jgi:hypothetical protein
VIEKIAIVIILFRAELSAFFRFTVLVVDIRYVFLNATAVAVAVVEGLLLNLAETGIVDRGVVAGTLGWRGREKRHDGAGSWKDVVIFEVDVVDQ